VLLSFGQQTTIKTTVPLVVLPASVTDPSGHFVYGLQASDFQVLDNGKPRTVHVENPYAASAPLALVVLIQTSDLSRSALLKIKKVGSMIPEAVAGANGEAAIVTFSDEVKIVQDFTNNADSISDTFQDLKAADSGKGRMIDAAGKALDMLAERPKAARSAIVIIGESKDRGSGKLNDLLSRIQESRATIYFLSYSAYLTAFTTRGSEYEPPDSGGLLSAIAEIARLGKKNAAEILTTATGGRILKFETKSKLENDLIRMGSEIHSRYILSFTPSEDPGSGFHTIQVKVRNRPQLEVRTRPGYWSSTAVTQ
jgi:VWFA-related protein